MAACPPAIRGEALSGAGAWVRTPAANDLLYPIRRILDVDVAVLQQADAIALVQQAVAQQSGAVFAFCNAHTANLARSDAALRTALAQATVFNDGIGVDLASELLYHTPFPDNLNGTDLTPTLLASLPAGTPVFLLGSAPGVAEKAGALLADHHGITVAGTYHGFFAEADEAALAERIRASGAQLVIAAMGNPRQEVWATRNAKQLGMPVLCVGAFLDFTARVVSRAPAVVRRLRLEWTWRLLLEPQRMARRYLVGNATFLLAVRQQRGALRHAAMAT
ncbi:WecB/TagA/CpsF family glycosyltransferase [Croceibacterium sp. TMG7-5b_MA50]|uniref:WecB/TagA/CpsF family glycosyltransferase n=1 Tax=Croceibacterium sp. TMG7-5b_MA50 TaxID=3121290 RepID=UPI003221E63E